MNKKDSNYKDNNAFKKQNKACENSCKINFNSETSETETNKINIDLEKQNFMFKIEGLDCPNCANALEGKIKNIDNVYSAKIDFLKQTLEIEASKDISKEYLIKKILKYNKDIKLIDKAENEIITLNISNLDCPNCAKALENKLNNIESVSDLKIDFLKSKLTYNSNDKNTSYNAIVNLTKSIYPNVLISSVEEQKNINLNNQNKNLKSFLNKSVLIDFCVLFFGMIIGAISLFVPMPVWLAWSLYVLSAIIIGYKTYIKAIRLLFRGIVNENLLVTISVIGASIIGDQMGANAHGGMSGHFEGLMVIILYTLGKIIEGIAINKSRKSIEELTNLKPDYAVLLEGSIEKKVLPQEIKKGDIIIVRPGEKVAVDGIVTTGNATLNKQSLTGESLPVEIKANEEILSGSIVLGGVLKIKALANFEDSTVSKILNLIENAQDKKSKTETVISKIARFYTIGVMILACLVFGIVYIALKDFSTALYRGLIFLVVSCPCAFAISVPLSYFSGIGCASKKGILIKGTNYLDILAKLNIVAFDKTGTLTTGEFEIEKIVSLNKNYSEEDILFLSFLGEQNSLHPLAKSIKNAFLNSNYYLQKFKKEDKVNYEIQDFKEVVGEGVYFKYNKDNYFLGRKNTLQATSVSLFKNDLLLGEIYLKDNIKASTLKTINGLKKWGIKTICLSGDNEEIVKEVSSKIGIDEYHFKMLPNDKFAYIENLKNNKSLIGFVGDGINDSPTLALADVGISMGLNGSDASIEASDIVLVDDNPYKIITAIKVSRFTRKIVWQNILLSAGIKFVFLLLGALGITGMTWAVIADVGVTLVAILNSLRALKYNPKD